MSEKHLTGTSLAGMSTTRERVEDDFYATPFSATEAILNEIELKGSILEPAAGQGHIVKCLKEHYPNNEIVSTDLIERTDRFDSNIKSGIDFITYNYGRKFDNVITNPPFALAQEFIEKGLEIANKYVIIFAKIQLLEGARRESLWNRNKCRYIYVFRKRANPMRNGEELDEKGRPWSSTMCFAWYVFDNEYDGEPVVRWL